jgi:hypothetical protein
MASRAFLGTRIVGPAFSAIALLAVFVLLLWSRFGSMGQSLWNDEAYSAVYFIRSGPPKILTRYIPNNHLLFNLLAWATARRFGESEIAYRFWGVAPACAAVVLVAMWLWNEQEATVAIAFSLLATMNLLLLELGREARGYGLTFLAQAGLLVVGQHALARRRGSLLLPYAAFGLLGTLTLPVFGLTFAAGACVLACERSLRRWVVVMLLVSAAVIGVFYGGIASQLFASSAQEFGERLPWYAPVAAPIRHFVLRTAMVLFAPTADASIVESLLALLVVLGCRRLWRQRKVQLAALLLVPIVASYACLAALRVFVEARFLSFLAINVTVLLALGVAECLWLVRRPRWLEVIAAGAMAAACVPPLERFVDVVRSTHALPRENFRDAAAIVRASGLSRVVTNSARPVGLFYYLPGVVRVEDPDQLEKDFCTASDGIAFIEHPFEAPTADVGCLERRGAVRERVLQREREEHIDVWMLYPQCDEP